MLAHMDSEVKQEQISNFAIYRRLLSKFGIDDNHLNNKTDEEKQHIKKVLDDLQFLFELISDASSYTIINWADVLFDEQGIDLSTIISTENRLLNNGSENSEKVLATIYTGLSFANLVFSIAALAHYNPSNTVATIFGSGWNYADAVGSMSIARQLHQEELVLGVINLIGNLQSLVCTIVANVLQYSYHVSAATVNGLLSFSSSIGMWINYGLELYEIYKCNNKIRLLENKLVGLSEKNNIYQVIQKAILIEKAQRENHVRSARSWAACAVVMTVIAIVNYIGFSGLTFGALPAVTLVLSMTVFATALIRQWWVSKKNHVDNVKESLKKTDKKCSLLDRLNQIKMNNELTFDFNKKILIKKSTFFANTEMTIDEYLKHLVIHNPKRLESILLRLEMGDFNMFQEAVNQNRPQQLKLH